MGYGPPSWSPFFFLPPSSWLLLRRSPHQQSRHRSLPPTSATRIASASIRGLHWSTTTPPFNPIPDTHLLFWRQPPHLHSVGTLNPCAATVRGTPRLSLLRRSPPNCCTSPSSPPVVFLLYGSHLRLTGQAHTPTPLRAATPTFA
jgi:hypothetical protein